MIEHYQEFLNECIDIQEDKQILENLKETNKIMRGNIVMFKNLGKHSQETHLVKKLQFEIEQLNETIKLKNRQIEDIQMECAGQFKQIRDLCFCNSYNDKLDTRKRFVKIEEIARDNFSALVKDLAIDKGLNGRANIKELPTDSQIEK